MGKECGVVGPGKDEQSLVPRQVFPAIIQGSNEWLSRFAQRESFFPVHALVLSMSTSCSPCTSTMKMEAVQSPRMVYNHRTTWYNNP
jgi:hypothetical protein